MTDALVFLICTLGMTYLLGWLVFGGLVTGLRASERLLHHRRGPSLRPEPRRSVGAAHRLRRRT